MATFLDNNQTKYFHQNGYVIVKNFFNDKEINFYKMLLS